MLKLLCGGVFFSVFTLWSPIIFYIFCVLWSSKFLAYIIVKILKIFYKAPENQEDTKISIVFREFHFPKVEKTDIWRGFKILLFFLIIILPGLYFLGEMNSEPRKLELLFDFLLFL